MVGISSESALTNDRTPLASAPIAPGIAPPDDLFNSDDFDWSRSKSFEQWIVNFT